MKKNLIWFLIVTFISTVRARAGTWGLFGYGAQNQAMGNSTVSLPTDGFSQNYNPALLALQSHPLLSAAVEGAITSFGSINQVVVDLPSLGATSVTTGNVDTHTDDTFLAIVAYQAPLSRTAEKPLHLGFYLSTPVQKFIGYQSEDSFQPQYALYLSDSQKFVAGANFGLRLSDKFSVGLGGELFFGQGIYAQLRLPTNQNSTADISATLKPAVAPVLGVLYEVDDVWKLGASYKGQENYQNTIEFNDTIGVMSGSAIPLLMAANSSLYFDPEYYLVGVSAHDGRNIYSAAANWQRWSSFQSTIINLSFQNQTGTFAQYLPPTPFHDIISLHTGFEHRFETTVLRAGYAFLPTPAPNQAGESNVLDSDKHVFSLGFGKRWMTSFIDGLLKLDIAGFVQSLVPKQVTKNSSQFIGAPGYNINGAVYGYNLTLTAEF